MSPEDTGEIVVISADGKGVIVRTQDLRPQTKKRAIASNKKLNKRLTRGEKSNAKRMATVASKLVCPLLPELLKVLVAI